MATNFPTSLDTYSDVPTNQATVVKHRERHQSVEDAVEAIEAKVGVNNSAVTSSLDYRVRNTPFTQTGTGAAETTLQAKATRYLDAGVDFGVTADGVTDDTAAMANAFARGKATGLPVRLPAGTILTSAALDISGVTLEGCAKGYRNGSGTIVQGSGTHEVFTQLTVDVSETRIDIRNVRIKGGTWGVKIRYMLHSEWENVHITDCTTGGIQLGNTTDAGCLFNTFTNVEVVVTGTGIDINGNGFVNANKFNQCFFFGTLYGGKLRCVGGIGATDNVFTCSEFLGDQYGLEMDNTANTVFTGCYFESKGPSLHLTGTRNLAVAANHTVWAILENPNPTGKNAFIYHQGTGSCAVSVTGGYIYIPAGAVYNGLSFIASENPSTMTVSMVEPPVQEISASGFTLLNSLTSVNLNVNQNAAYTPTWTATGSNPSLGNGTIAGHYTRAGNIVTVTISLTAGSTSTYGAGDYLFSLPFTAQTRAVGSAFIFDNGTAYHDGMPVAEPGSSSVAVYRAGGSTLVGPTVPMTWTTSDAITITITYRA